MNGLALQVQETLGRDPFAGDLFVFRGRRGDVIKVLWHDGLGMSLYAKIPRQWKVIQHVREKMTCRDCEKISEPPAPFHVCPRGWAGPNLLAMLLFEKFGQHQPLNRQAERYAREGVSLSLSMLADQVGAGCVVLEPLLRRIESHVFAAERLHGDDTTVPVLAKGKTDIGRCWVSVRDDRPFGGGAPPAAMFYYSRDRGGEQAPAPNRLIEGGLPTEALVADVLVSKYADHLPPYRQAQILGREGVQLDRSTLARRAEGALSARRVGFAAYELAPLHERLVAILKTSTKLFADETRCPVLDPGRGKTKTGYLWAIARDDRPWSGADPPAVAYTYAPGRGGEHATKLLAGFSGVLQVDDYAGYDKQADAARSGGPLVLAYCWSHFRRRFYDIAKGGNAPIASEALHRIAELYAIEADIRGRSAEERRAERQARTRPLVETLRGWLDEQLRRVSGRSSIAEAMRYGTSHWQGLCRFLDDGRIEIDTNTLERTIRPIAPSRKNALFAGSDAGGANWAIIASLIETAKLNGVNPHAWLADTLTKLVNRWPQSRIDELMPWAYAKIPA